MREARPAWRGWRIEARVAPARLGLVLAPLAALAATLLTCAGLLAALGLPVRPALHALFVSPFGSAYGLAEIALKAGPLIMIGVGLAAGFRAGVWNIGAEGQLTVGALAGGGLALALHDAEGGWVLPLMALAGALGGAAYAAVPAFLRTRYGASEILTSLLLTYVAGLVLGALVYGPWKDPEGFNFPQSRLFSPSASLSPLIEGARVTWGTVAGFAVAPLAWLVLARSRAGFGVRAVGFAPAAARYGGFARARAVWLTMLAGGALAGLAGVFEVAGPIGQLIPHLTAGYGFAAIVVAFLGRLHPLGIVGAGLAMALSYIGGENAQVEAGLPKAVTGVVQGLLLFFLLAADALTRLRLRRLAAPQRDAPDALAPGAPA